MAYPSITSYNQSEGIQTIFIYINDVTDGAFINLMLFSFFLILTIYSYYMNKRTSGENNFLGSVVASAFVTTGCAIILSSINGLVTSNTLLLWGIGTIITFIFWVFSRD